MIHIRTHIICLFLFFCSLSFLLPLHPINPLHLFAQTFSFLPFPFHLTSFVYSLHALSLISHVLIIVIFFRSHNESGEMVLLYASGK